MDTEVRHFSKESRSFSYEEHKAWFRQILTNGNVYLFIATYKGLPVGSGRLLRIDDGWSLSYAVCRIHRRLSIGKQIVQCLILEAHRLGGKVVSAEVRSDNLASIRAVVGAGFVVDMDPVWITFTKDMST
jgi:L-amino acid N-acyltransferase YncA